MPRCQRVCALGGFGGGAANVPQQAHPADCPDSRRWTERYCCARYGQGNERRAGPGGFRGEPPGGQCGHRRRCRTDRTPRRLYPAVRVGVQRRAAAPEQGVALQVAHRVFAHCGDWWQYAMSGGARQRSGQDASRVCRVRKGKRQTADAGFQQRLGGHGGHRGHPRTGLHPRPRALQGCPPDAAGSARRAYPGRCIAGGRQPTACAGGAAGDTGVQHGGAHSCACDDTDFGRVRCSRCAADHGSLRPRSSADAGGDH